MKILYIVVLIAALKYAEATCYNGSIAACHTCNGECSTGECFCLDPSISCVPEKGECITGDNSCCPTGYYYNVTASCCTDTVICNKGCGDDEICVNGICSCDPVHYKGKTIQDLKPLVECSSDVMTVSVSRCLLTYLKYNYTTAQLADNSSKCFPLADYNTIDNNLRMDHFQIQLKSNYCGNVITNDSEKLYVTNTVHYDVLQSKLITVNPLYFNVTCAFNLSMQISLNFSLHPVVGSTFLPGINGTGSFPITMAAYWDDKFSSAIQQDQTVTVGTDIFLGLFVTNADGSLFTLRVVSCVASPTNTRDDISKVSLVTGGCAAKGDIATVVEQNGVSLEARIRVGTFKFQSADNVYIFCDVQLCDKGANCSKCDSSASSRSSPDTRQVSIQVPYERLDYDLPSSSITHSALPWSVLCGTLLGFLSIKLF